MKNNMTTYLSIFILTLLVAGYVGMSKSKQIQNPVPPKESHLDLRIFFLGLETCLRNPVIWNSVISDEQNVQLECLREAKNCENGKSGDLVVNKIDPDRGCYGFYGAFQNLNNLGMPCTPDAANASNCNYAVHLKSSLNCNPELKTCRNPTVIVDATVGSAKKSFSMPAFSERSFILTQRFPKGTPGGACEKNWQLMRFNSIDRDTADAMIGLNADGSIQLAAGRYQCEFVAPAYRVGAHQAMLFNATSKSLLAMGSSEVSADTPEASQTSSHGIGEFTLKEKAIVSFYHFCEKTPKDKRLVTSALGNPTGKFPEMYAELSCKVF